MSVTVEDVLKLPTLRNARVVAGKSALQNIVNGVTVFEYKAPMELQDRFFQHTDRHLASCLVLTSFASIRDDEDLQLRYLRRIAVSGDAALVIFYSGVVMESVRPSLIQLAEDLGFPLIVMPEGRLSLTYADVISEVSEAVLSDRMQYSGSMVTEIIGRVSQLPSDRQTVDSVLKLLSSKLHCTLILTDSNLNELGEAPWPSDNDRIAGLITEENVSHHVKRRKAFSPRQGSFIWYVPIHDRGMEPMRLFLIEEGATLTGFLVDMAREAVQLSVELWSKGHSEVLTSELIKSILNDEPIRMRRLSEELGIDIRSIHTSWFIRCTDNRPHFTKEMMDAVRSTMSALDSDILLEAYRSPLGSADDLIMFFRNPLDARLLDSCAQSIIDRLHECGCSGVYLTMLDYKATTADVRKAFSFWNENEAKARIVFPQQSIFHESEIELVRQCNDIIRLGEASISAATGCLEALDERNELLKTLEVYFLDAEMNMQVCSEILNVHKNTIKYRINMVCDALGHSISSPVATSRLTIALALRRLLEKAI
ncbi:MAG: PucR family transcriptional regulator ligand-binding domain-containing protein [Spirochaetales bacterium]|nr:PucR family transcriptional regulator ligand-binding domain-containing protein [Spirochaetales bacterium]